jgi:hypothetical protein
MNHDKLKNLKTLNLKIKTKKQKKGNRKAKNGERSVGLYHQYMKEV